MAKSALSMATVVCLVAVASLVAAGPVNGQCSMGQMSQCMGAVTRGLNPTPQCCAQVGAITNFNCFCNMMQSQRSSIPPAYIANAVLVPGKCGAQGAHLRGQNCGSK